MNEKAKCILAHCTNLNSGIDNFYRRNVKPLSCTEWKLSMLKRSR